MVNDEMDARSYGVNNGGAPDNKVSEESSSAPGNQKDSDGVQVSCFIEDVPDGSLNFQIIQLQKQIYVWIGYNSAKFGHLYAAAPTRPSNLVSVASILGGGADNSGSSIARRLVLKTGLNVVLACSLPKDSPMLEASAEKILFEKLRVLGLIRPKSEQSLHAASTLSQ